LKAMLDGKEKEMLRYPLDWRQLPTADDLNSDDVSQYWVSATYTFRKADTTESAIAGAENAIQRALAANGIVALATSPSRSEVRHIVRKGHHCNVAVDIFATRAQIATGIPHEVAAACYAFIEHDYPIQVAVAMVAVSDNHSVPVARFIANEPVPKPQWQRQARVGCPVDSCHFFAVRPRGPQEAQEFRARRAEEAAEKEQRRWERVFRPKYISPPPPDWLIRLSSAAREGRSPSVTQRHTDSLFELPRCHRCAKYGGGDGSRRGGDTKGNVGSGGVSAAATTQQKRSEGHGAATDRTLSRAASASQSTSRPPSALSGLPELRSSPTPSAPAQRISPSPAVSATVSAMPAPLEAVPAISTPRRLLNELEGLRRRVARGVAAYDV